MSGMLKNFILAVLLVVLIGACAGPAPSGRPPPTLTNPSSTMPGQSLIVPSAATSSIPTRTPRPVLVPTTRLCPGTEPFAEPSELDCADAIEAALATLPDQVGALDAELRWNLLCVEDPCATPSPTVAQVIVRFADGKAKSVVLHQDSSGRITADEPVPVRPADLEALPTFDAPPTGLSAVADPPVEVATRTPVPMCGRDRSGVAGQFNETLRQCFRAAVLNSESAEFVAVRSGVEGTPVLELWRYEGQGPIIVYIKVSGAWTKLTCALELIDDAEQFGRTDCDQVPVT